MPDDPTPPAETLPDTQPAGAATPRNAARVTPSRDARGPDVLVRGAALTAAVLGGAVLGHCLAGGHVPGPAVLGVLAALVLVGGVLAARATQGRARRTLTVLASAALAVGLHPVLGALTVPTAAVAADPHAAHRAPAAVPLAAGADVAGGGTPPADDVAAATPELAALVAHGVDLDAVRAAGWDLDALVAAGLGPEAVAAAGLDPADEHAPHTIAGMLTAADRAAVEQAADVAPAAPAPAAPGPADRASGADPTGPLGVVLTGDPRPVAVSIGALLAAVLASVVLTLPPRRRGTGSPSVAAS